MSKFNVNDIVVFTKVLNNDIHFTMSYVFGTPEYRAQVHKLIGTTFNIAGCIKIHDGSIYYRICPTVPLNNIGTAFFDKYIFPEGSFVLATDTHYPTIF